MRALKLLLIVATFVACGNQNTDKDLGQDSKTIFIEELMSKMTLQEKIGQMTQSSSPQLFTGPEISDSSSLEMVREGRMGSFLNMIGVSATRAAQEVAVNESRLGIPLIFGYDMIHGFATTFPIPLAEAASWNLDLIQKSAEITAREAAASGQHWNFAPMVDIARDPRWGRIMEGAGEDPWWGAQVAAARVRGFQGDDLALPTTIAATAKHFAGYGAAEGGRDYNTTEISERTLREIYLPPFEAAANAGVASFMNAFNDLNGVPATGSKFLVRQILKEAWNWKGFVVSDWASVEEMIDHGYAEDEKAAARLALEAGCDMEMVSKTYDTYLDELVSDNPDYLAFIDDAVYRILSIKYDLGLFEDPFRYCSSDLETQTVRHKDHFDHALEMARESIVLLENREQILPLSPELNSIAVIGPLADDQETPLGNWSAQGRPEDVISVLQGIRGQVKDRTQILHTAGCAIDSEDRSGFLAARQMARSADAVVAVVGEQAMMSGEALGRSDISLPGVQLELLKTLKDTGTPVIVVLMSGRPIAEPWMYEHCDAVLEAWHLGVQTGPAIADILFGDGSPSGKLPVTVPRSVGQVPIYYNHKNTGRPADPESKWTSKYIDIDFTPQYPFGYGLSYTSFSYSDLELDRSVLNTDQTLVIKVKVTNRGTRPGKEVVQLYIRDLFGSVTRPVKELKGIQKILLNPGESRWVNFSLDERALRFWDRDMVFQSEPGMFEVFVGGNSRDVLKAEFELIE